MSLAVGTFGLRAFDEERLVLWADRDRTRVRREHLREPTSAAHMCQ